MKFEQHWPSGFRGEVFEILNIFSILMYGAHTNAQGSKLLFGLASRVSTIGFHLLWHTVELAMR